MARRRRRNAHEEHENHERWLVSYADFITLLFAFFVVMYSISSINEGKYRILSETLDGAFRDPMRSFNPIQIGDIIHNRELIEKVMMLEGVGDKPIPDLFSDAPPEQTVSVEESELSDGPSVDEQKMLDQITEDLNQSLSQLIESDLVSVRREALWVEIEMKSSLLFGSGDASLSETALRVLWKVARPIRRISNPIHVEGFTDNIPINTFEFPSNWELSAARAASVVHLFTKYGIDPERMAAVGYGEFHPIADNKSIAGRDKNRRVVVVVQSQAISRFDQGKEEKIDVQNRVQDTAKELQEALTGEPVEIRKPRFERN